MKPNEELLPQEPEPAKNAGDQQSIEQSEPSKEETEVNESDKELTRNE